jgi:dihydropteroate synthase
MHAPQILGILNVTADSFSDGGRYLDPASAVAHGKQLRADGADFVDVGAQSTRPGAEQVAAETEIERLTPVIAALNAADIPISVDTFRPSVMAAALQQGVAIINDVTAGKDPAIPELLASHDCRVLIMHSTSTEARAERTFADPATMLDRVLRFFEQRIAAFESAGVARERFILDPGMGAFLGSEIEASLVVLRGLKQLRANFGLPVCVSPARKSVIGQLLSEPDQPRPVTDRDAGTLAAELWSLTQGVEFIRTHTPRQLRDVVRVWSAIAAE